MKITSQAPSAFWRDLAEDLEDPQFLRAYVTESLRIATIDRLLNLLDVAREEEHLSKAELARMINSQPAVIRRLLSKGGTNPTIGTLVDVATALGFRVTLEPLPKREREEITRPLRDGAAIDPDALARRLEVMRNSDTVPEIAHTVTRERELVPA